MSKFKKSLAVILSVLMILSALPLASLSVGATPNAYTFVKPDLIELTPNAEWTAVQFDMSQLDFTLAGDRTPSKLRLVLEGAENGVNDVAGTLTNQEDSSKTIHFGMSSTENTQTVHYQRMLDWSCANDPQIMYFYISADEWSAAVPGTYSGTVSYHFMWIYSTNPKTGDDFDYGTFPITVTIPEPGHPVTVTAEPSEGGTVSGAGNYEEDAQVNLTATPSDGWRFKEWQVVSGGVTIENNSFTMPDHAVEVKAVFEEKPTYPVTVTAEPSEGGTVEGAGAYKEGMQVNLTATPSDGYFFKGWQVVNGGVTIENSSFTMPDHAVEVKAVFDEIIPPQYDYNSDTKELHLISGDFDDWHIWENGNVPINEVLSVTAEEGVRFVGDCTWLFYDFSACKSMELSAVDTSLATDMRCLFEECYALTSLDLSNWDTDAVTNMSDMFHNCESLTDLNFGSFDTGNVTDMFQMFSGCKSLVALDLSGFDTAKVRNMEQMFRECEDLVYLDLRGFNTSAVTNMWGMFFSCEKITALDLSSFDTRCANYTSDIFSCCLSLCRLTLSPHIAVTENMALNNGGNRWVAEGSEGEVVSGDGGSAVIAAPEQVTTFVWRNMPESFFIGHSVSLDDDIGLNFYISRNYFSPDGTVQFEWFFKGEKKTASGVIVLDYNAENRLRATCHLSADEINCAVKVMLKHKGDYLYDVFSASRFAYRITDQTDEHASVSDIKVGNLSLGTKKAFSGYEVKLYLSVDKGYIPDQITLTAQDGTDVPCTLSNKDGEYIVTFTMPEQAVTLSGSSTGILIGDTNIGDTNRDGRVDIRDATAIQKHIAGLITLEGSALAAADTDGSGTVDVNDVTHLQKYIAKVDGIVLGIQPTA